MPPNRTALTPVEWLYQDDDLLVLNKPAGLLSVPGRGDDKQDCLSARVQAVCPSACVVHRLDMATSGLMVMALNPTVQRALNRQFELRTVHKRYIAVVNGELNRRGHQNVTDNIFDNIIDNTPSAWTLIDLPIAVDWPNRPLRVINHTTGKPSQTRWQALAFDAATHTTRVALEPITGRSHQLRVHLQAIGHPMVGDALYAPAHVQAKAARLLLHAHTLTFDHPQTAQRLSFTSQPPF